MVLLIFKKKARINNIIMDIVTNYVKTENGKRIICFLGDRQSFRCRQRSRNTDGFKCPPLRFVSFKETQKEMKKKQEKVSGPYVFYSLARM
tara:strand:- start:17 stop:289 length:273 start_codon:yes stop_codon:yes gene_type:complete